MRRILPWLIFPLVNFLSMVAVAGDPDATKTRALDTSEPQKWCFTADVELNSPLIGSLAGGDSPFDTFAVNIRLGARKKRVNIFGFAERGHFDEPSYDPDVSNDLFSFGAGGSISYFHSRMRTMLLLGATVLLTDSFQNERGTMGFFSELRPAGFEFSFGEFNLQLYPITLSWLIPVMQNIPLFYVHYRTAISIGGTF